MNESHTNLQGENSFEEVVHIICELIQNEEYVDIDRLADEYPEMACQLRSLYPTLLAIATLESSSSNDAFEGNFDQGEAATLGDFRILRQIGRGGMGVVYEAQQVSIPRRVAIKVLPLAALIDPRALQRFKNEVTAIATLEHPHIVSVYSIGEERGIHYFAMQLIRGQSLAAVIRELSVRTKQSGSVTGEMIHQVVSDLDDLNIVSTDEKSELSREDVNDEFIETATIETKARGRSTTDAAVVTDQTYFRNVARLMLQAADALQHAHDHGIVHRDIKPGNLLLDKNGGLIVSDFGLARIETSAGETLTGDMLGTLRYMSPEQVLAGRVMVDNRTDIYSLGATLYETLTLRPMWAGSNKAELIRQISFEDPVRPQKINPAIPLDLETIVLKAINKSLGDRYDSAQAMADDLGRYLDGEPIHARRATVSERVTKWAIRHRAMVGLALVAFFLIAVTSSIASVLVWKESQRRIQAVLEGQAAIQTAMVANEKADLAAKRIGIVNDFVLKNIVQSANPLTENGSRDITVRESLLAANKKVDDAFKDELELMSHAKFNFGHYLLAIGEYTVARQDLEDALHGYIELYGKENRHSIDTMSDLTRVYLELDELELALSSAKKVVVLSQSLYGKLDHDSVDSLFKLGAVFGKQKQFGKAERTLNETIAVARDSEFPLIEALATMELGNISFYQKEYAEAEAHWLSALTVFKERKSAFNIIVANNNLTNVYWQTGRQTEAVENLQLVLNQFSELVGPTHPRTLNALNKLAGRKYDSGDLDSAVNDYRLLVTRFRSKFGPKHEALAEAMCDLGSVLQSIGELKEALEVQKNALEILKAKFGDHHLSVIFTLGSLALTYSEMGDFENASQCFRQVIEVRLAIVKQQPDNSDNIVSLCGAYCNLGNLLTDEKGKPEEALEFYAKAIDMLEKTIQESPTVLGKKFLVNIYINRSHALGLMQQWETALADADNAVLHATTPGSKDGMRLWKARLLAMSGDIVAASAITEDVLTRATDDDDDTCFLAARVLGLCAGKSSTLVDSDKPNSPLFNQFATRSVQVLSQANDYGYFRYPNRIDELSKEQDFDAIRDSVEFNELLVQINHVAQPADQE